MFLHCWYKFLSVVTTKPSSHLGYFNLSLFPSWHLPTLIPSPTYSTHVAQIPLSPHGHHHHAGCWPPLQYGKCFWFFFFYFVPISNSSMSTRVISQKHGFDSTENFLGHTNSLKLFSRALGSCWAFSAFTIAFTTSPTPPFPGHPRLSGLLCFLLLFPDGGASMADHIIFVSMLQAVSFLWVGVWCTARHPFPFCLTGPICYVELHCFLRVTWF